MDSTIRMMYALPRACLKKIQDSLERVYSDKRKEPTLDAQRLASGFAMTLSRRKFIQTTLAQVGVLAHLSLGDARKPLSVAPLLSMEIVGPCSPNCRVTA
jgi:hypothetical protein